MQSPRRRFLKVLATAPLVGTGAASPAASPPPALQPQPEPAADPVVEALAEVVRRQFGAHLDAAELEEVRRELARNRAGAERLRKAARLRNADGPAARFEARPRPRGQSGR